MKINVDLLRSAQEKFLEPIGDEEEISLLSVKELRQRVFASSDSSYNNFTEAELRAVKEYIVEHGNSSREYSFSRFVTVDTIEAVLREFDKKVDAKGDLLPIKGISKVMQARLRSKLHINDAATLLYRGRTIAGRREIAARIGANLTDVDSWVKQSNLWQLEGMTADMAYLLVLIGVRHVSDLSNVDVAKAIPYMKSLSRTLTDFSCDEDLLTSLISSAKAFAQYSVSISARECQRQFDAVAENFKERIRNTDKKISFEDFERFQQSIKDIFARETREENVRLGATEIETLDGTPTYLFVDGFDYGNAKLGNVNSSIVSNGLRLLINTCETLPFPSVVSGQLVCQKHSNGFCDNLCNAQIEIISGIVSTLEDDVLDQSLSTYTDSEGNFILCLPSSYSLKDYIRITVTKNNKQQTFVKSRTEFLKSMPCFNEFNQKDEDFIKAYKDLFPYVKLNADVDFNTIGDGSESNRTEKEIEAIYEYAEALRKEYVRNLSDDDRTAKLGSLNLLDDIFEDKIATVTDSGNALPSVRLMGSEADDFDEESTNKIINLNCDSAPVESFSYCMLQRLIAPSLSMKDVNGKEMTCERENISSPLDVDSLKDAFINNSSSFPLASTLGMGYVLNMHQGWLPDGFSLGSLLYSLVLAPGEEQKLIVRENTQSYLLTDEALGADSDKESYMRSDRSDVQALYNYGAQLTSDANSSYDYSTKASSYGGGISGSGGMAGIFGLSGSFSGASSKSSGNASSAASQTNNQDEASFAAQTFQNNIRTASEKLSQSTRVSMSIATSAQSDSVATKVIANHNHSHAMTIQYWEVMRNYKLETNVDSVDLVLYVPLKPIQFLPVGQSFVYGETESSVLNSESEEKTFGKAEFKNRYSVVLKHATALSSALPYKYRSGLNLIQQFAATPNWEMEPSSGSTRKIGFYTSGFFLENDDITINLVLKNGKGKIHGEVKYDRLKLPNIFTTRADLQKAITEVWKGNPGYVSECIQKRVDDMNNRFVISYEKGEKKLNFKVGKGLDDYFKFDVMEGGLAFYEFFRDESIEMGSWGYFYRNKYAGDEKISEKDDEVVDCSLKTPVSSPLSCVFEVPSNVNDDDINYVEVIYNRNPISYTLSRGFSQLDENQIKACVEMYEEKFYNARNNKDNENEEIKIEHYKSLLPESFRNTSVNLTSSSLRSLGSMKLADMKFGVGETSDTLSQATISMPSVIFGLESGTTKLSVVPMAKTLHTSEFQKMEETFQHIVSNGIKFSQVIWNGLTENERVILLEKFNLNLSNEDVKKLKADASDSEVQIPLLNCINVKKVLGYYGNCMLFPFTFPEELSEQLGMTAADLQNRIYRFHVNGFKAPTTRISIPTKGMVGEAVLGESNVSEKIDITRFWNWQDSPINSMELNNNYLNGEDYLDNKKTMEIKALNLANAEAATPITDVNYLSDLISKRPATFNDITGLDQLKDVLSEGASKTSDNLSSVMTSNQAMTQNALDSLTQTQKSQIEAESKKQETAASLLSTLFGGKNTSAAAKSAADSTKKETGGDKPGQTNSKPGESTPKQGETPTVESTSTNNSAFSEMFASLGDNAKMNLVSSLFGAAIGNDSLSLSDQVNSSESNNSSEVEALKQQVAELSSQLTSESNNSSEFEALKQQVTEFASQLKELSSKVAEQILQQLDTDADA